MIYTEKKIVFVVIENHGDPICGGYGLYALHKNKKDLWLIAPLIVESDIENMYKVTLTPIYIIRQDMYSVRSQWLYSQYPSTEDTRDVLGKFADLDKVVKRIIKKIGV